MNTTSNIPRMHPTITQSSSAGSPVRVGDSKLSSQLPSDEHAEEEELLLPPRQKFKDPSWMMKDVGERIHLIAHWEVGAITTPVTSIGGYEFLCSYSWKQTTIPTIYVPGSPARWTPPLLPKQLDPDEGFHWCDQHGHRVPRHQFEPIFQALAVMNPTIRFNNVNVVVNRNTLQKLLSFASFKRGSGPFYVNLDMVQNTLFISRREAKAKTRQCTGYGRNFETEFTTKDPQLPRAEGHHRVIRYKFGSLNLVVRIEADGYYPEGEEDNMSPNEFFQNVLGTTTQTTIEHHSLRPIVVLALGTMTPHNNTLELKSKGSKRGAFPQLWFGRTPYLCCAKHREGAKGLVETASVMRMKQTDFEEWETENQRHLLRLAWFLEELRRITMENTSKGAAVLVMTEKGAPLQIYEARNSDGALPEEIVKRFWD